MAWGILMAAVALFGMLGLAVASARMERETTEVPEARTEERAVKKAA
ncbi:hypothetical protein [Nitrospira sp. Kam-Ns4a]